MTSNPFILIDWDPHDLNLAGIRKRIGEKKVDWEVKKRGSGAKAAEFRECLELLKTAEPLLLERKWAGVVNEAKYQEFVKEAKAHYDKEREQAEATVAKLIKLAVPKGHVSQAELDKLVKDYGRYVPEAEIRRKIAVPIRSALKKGDQVDTAHEALYAHVVENLKALGMRDLFEFLSDPAAGDKFTQGTPSKRLAARAEVMKRALLRQNNHTPELDARDTLVGHALTIFDDSQPERRKKYETSLAFEKIAFLAESLAFAGVEGSLSAEAYEALLEDGMKAGAPRALVEEFLSRRVRERRIALVKPSNSPLYQKEPCPVCSTLNAENAKFCGKCSAPLAVDCPRCNTPAKVRDTVCTHCGFRLGDMPLAKLKVKEAQALFDRDDAAGALSCLAEAEDLWPKLDATRVLREKALATQKAHAAAAIRLQEMLAGGRVMEAMTLLSTLDLSTAEKSKVKAELDRRQTEALEYCRLAKAELAKHKPQAALALLARGAGLARDLPEVQQLATDLAPAAPDRPVAKAAGPSIQITWGVASDGTDLQYSVSRRNLSAREAQPRALSSDLTSRTYLDADVKAGCTYEYEVAAVRMGIVSPSSAPSRPVTAVAEVRAISAVPGDGCLNLAWEAPEGAVAIEVLAKKDSPPASLSDGRRVSGVTLHGVTDYDVTNQVTYGYRIAAIFYSASGESILSPGATITAKVQPLPARIERLMVNLLDGNIEASWPAPSRGRAHLFWLQRQALAPGEVMEMLSLAKLGQKLPIASASSARFVPPATGSLTFTVASELDGVAVVGASATVQVEVVSPEVREIHFRVRKNRFIIGGGYVLELFTHQGSFRAPELGVYSKPNVPPRHSGDGHLLQRIAERDLTDEPVRIALDQTRLRRGEYIGVAVTDPAQAARYRVFKPSLETLKIS